MDTEMANFTTQAKEWKDPAETEKVFVANPIVERLLSVKWGGAPRSYDKGLWLLRYATLQGRPQAHPLTVLDGIPVADEEQMS